MTAGICVANGVCRCVWGTAVVATVISMDPSGGDSTSPYMYGGVGGFSPLTVIWTGEKTQSDGEIYGTAFFGFCFCCLVILDFYVI